MKKFLVFVLILVVFVGCSHKANMKDDILKVKKYEEVFKVDYDLKNNKEIFLRFDKKGNLLDKLVINANKEKGVRKDTDDYIVVVKKPLTPEEIEKRKKMYEMQKKLLNLKTIH